MDDQQTQLLQERIAGPEQQLAEKTAALKQKNRALEIEAALERVCPRSLAMHKSDELQAVVHTVFGRLNELNVQLYTAIIVIVGMFSNAEPA